MKVRQKLIDARGNLTQKEVAIKLNISQQQLSSYEKGVRNPKIQLAYKLSQYYDIPVEELFPDLIEGDGET